MLTWQGEQDETILRIVQIIPGSSKLLSAVFKESGMVPGTGMKDTVLLQVLYKNPAVLIINNTGMYFLIDHYC